MAYEYNTEFSRVLGERCRFFATDPAADTLTRVQGELVEVKGIMIENIEKVLERGEKLDLLGEDVMIRRMYPPGLSIDIPPTPSPSPLRCHRSPPPSAHPSAVVVYI